MLMPGVVCLLVVPGKHAVRVGGLMVAYAQASAPQQGQHYEIEEWIVNFARVLTDVTGLDPST